MFSHVQQEACGSTHPILMSSQPQRAVRSSIAMVTWTASLVVLKNRSLMWWAAFGEWHGFLTDGRMMTNVLNLF